MKCGPRHGALLQNSKARIISNYTNEHCSFSSRRRRWANTFCNRWERRSTAELSPRGSSPSDDPGDLWQNLMWRVTNQTTPPDTRARGNWAIKPHMWRETVTLDFALARRTEKSILVWSNINLNEGHTKSSSQRGHSTNDDQQYGNTELSEGLSSLDLTLPLLSAAGSHCQSDKAFRVW